jgi:glycosyltransferase involved in cell wall biosynthesis
LINSPLFTVVIPTYNRKNLIKNAIKSVINQTYTNWKLLIIDDASTDGTAEALESFLTDKRIQLLQLEKNVGIAKVFNIALEKIDTSYFVHLDSDDWFELNTLEELAQAINKADEETALFYGNSIFWKSNSNKRKKKMRYRKIKYRKKGNKKVRNSKYKFSKYLDNRLIKDKYDYLLSFDLTPLPRCYRTAAVRAVGGWDTHHYNGRIMEDRQICLKLIGEYPFYWIDKYLHNRLKHTNQLTDKSTIPKRNKLRKYLIEHYLKKWGDEYKPIYTTSKSGYLRIKELVKK